MNRRIAFAVALVTIVSICGTGLASAQYNYGRSGYGSDDEGFIVRLESILTNPRNTDNVVASSSASRIIPVWDDELAGRIEVGYEWSGGRKILVGFWGYQTDVPGSGAGSFEFPIGPTTGSTFASKTEIMASTVDARVAVTQQATDALEFEWSIGLRYAEFEESTDATYGTAGGPVAAAKRNEGSMIGPKLGGRATYRFGERYSVGAGLGLSMLDGEIEASSVAGSTFAMIDDDGRSGRIVDFDVTGSWHSSSDTVRISLGWEQSEWEDIAADLLRNPTGTVNVLNDRDSVTFSGYKLGVRFKF